MANAEVELVIFSSKNFRRTSRTSFPSRRLRRVQIRAATLHNNSCTVSLNCLLIRAGQQAASILGSAGVL